MKHHESTYNDEIFVFQRPDGKYMHVIRDGGMERAMWEEWVDDFMEATEFHRRDGLAGDHRWARMVGDSKPVAYQRFTHTWYE